MAHTLYPRGFQVLEFISLQKISHTEHACNCLSHTPATPTYASHIAPLVLDVLFFFRFYERKWSFFDIFICLEDQEILRYSPHERTIRQVRTDIGEKDLHLSYTNRGFGYAVRLAGRQAAFVHGSLDDHLREPPDFILELGSSYFCFRERIACGPSLSLQKQALRNSTYQL